MRNALAILFFIPIFTQGQWILNSDTVDHISLAEYCNLAFKASTHQVYNNLNVVPQLCTNQASYMSEIFAGPHDAIAISPIAPGNLYIFGSVFGGNGNFQHITVDSAGNALPAVTGALCTASNTSPFWTDVIWTTDSTTGRQVGIAGELAGGMHGNGTDISVNQTSWVWATFPNNTHIVKVVGQYVLWALDSKGNVWSWAGANNKAQLQRGTVPSVTYKLPDKITLPAGRFAIDICNSGPFGVILLDDGEVLGGGDHPKYWGGASASTSNTPQNFSAFLTSSAGIDPATGQSFVPAKLFSNSSNVFYIGVDSTLVSSGDNVCGSIGNGVMFSMNNYRVSPPPNGSTPQPYAYDNGLEEFMQYTPVRICKGAHNWVVGYMGPSNCWNANFVNNIGQTFVWGRGKSMQTFDNRASCNYVLGGLNGTYPDMINMPYPIQISPFTITSGTLITPTCFYCIANPGALNCSQGTSCYNGALAAPVIHTSTQNLSSKTTTASITPSITYASGSKELFNIVTFQSGPTTPILPFNTGSTINISGLTTGTYIFKDSSTDIMWKTAVAFDTIVIGNSNSTPAALPYRATASIDTTWNRMVVCPSAAYVNIDTLSMPPNSSGTFDICYYSYDTVQNFTGSGKQTIMVNRFQTIYSEPYVAYNSPYITSGISTHQSGYNVSLINGLPIIRVSGYGPKNPIRWHVVKDAKISSL